MFNLILQREKLRVPDKSGIYEISCESKYVDQTKRSINIRRNKQEQSTVADHFLENLNHEINTDHLILLVNVNETNRLDAY